MLAALLATPCFAEDASLWQSANDSTIRLVETNGQVTMTYQDPNFELMQNGVRRGSLVFQGQRSGDQLTGTSYSYFAGCPLDATPARASFRGTSELIIQFQSAEQQGCRIVGRQTRTARLTRLTPIVDSSKATSASAPGYAPVEYTPPASIDYTISAGVRFFGATAPYLQIVLAIIATAWTLVAAIDLPARAQSPNIVWRRSSVFIVLIAACIGLYLTTDLYRQLDREYARIKQARAQLEQTISTTSPGRERDKAIRSLETLVPDSTPDFALALYLSPTFLLLLVYSLAFLRGSHFLFARHPAAAVAAPALRSGSLFDNSKLADALDPDITQFHQPQPAYKIANMLRKGKRESCTTAHFA